MTTLTATAVDGLPEITTGDDLAAIIAERYQAAADMNASGGVIFVISQKVVSKAEGRTRALATVEPNEWARDFADAHGKDARQVQAVLDETRELLRHESGVLITETNHGFVCANAGVDASNVPQDDTVLLLPVNPDASARQIRAGLNARLGLPTGVVIADSFGRAWRIGQCDVAIGCAGVTAVSDLRGERDRDGRELSATVVATADQLAAAADLVRTKDSGQPVVAITGCASVLLEGDGDGISSLLRDRSLDLFR